MKELAKPATQQSKKVESYVSDVLSKTTKIEGYGESKAKVKLPTEAKAIVKGFGIKDKDLASLVGATDDAEVTVKVVQGLRGEKDTLLISTKGDGYQSTRYLGRDNNGELFLQNDTVRVEKTGNGLGAEIFGRQVENAAKLGVKRIMAHAAGNAEKENYNGYYTWPRFGYDQSVAFLTSKIKERVKRDWPDAKSVQDIMVTSNGRNWWKKNGGDLTDAEFDLKEGSRSMQIFQSYVKERNERKGKS